MRARSQHCGLHELFVNDSYKLQGNSGLQRLVLLSESKEALPFDSVLMSENGQKTKRFKTLAW